MTKKETLEAFLEAEFEQDEIESLEDHFNEALASVEHVKMRIDRMQQAGLSPLTSLVRDYDIGLWQPRSK